MDESQRLIRSAKAIVQACEQGYGPKTKPADREPVIQWLQHEGCTRQEIADIFGVSRGRIDQHIADIHRRQSSGGRI